jgi:malonate transporter and related proteins
VFRTTAPIDLGHLPCRLLAENYGPAEALLLAVYGSRRLDYRRATVRAQKSDISPADPAIQAISTAFGNSVQLGLPVVAALFGQVGLSVHIAIISMHALTLMTTATVLAELDLARAEARVNGNQPRILNTVWVTARRAVIHPVVLPVILGLIWNLLPWGLPGPVDDALGLLSQGVAPVCLITIGMSLAHYGVSGVIREATVMTLGKLVLMPAIIFVVAHWGAGFHGVTLSTMVLFGALPTGSNALIFAQRYRAREAEVTATIMMSTLGFALTAPLWLVALRAVA